MQKNNLFEFELMSTKWFIESIDNKNIPEKQILKISNEFVKKYSRFDESSLLGQVNKNKILHNPPKEMLNMLNFAKQMFQDSNGLFNISVGGELNRLGYGNTKNSGTIHTDIWDKIMFNEEKINLPTDIVLDFGGFGKGWLIDVLVEFMNQNNLENFIINGGGDLYVSSNTPIDIALEHPLDPTKKIGQTLITKGALAVSSTKKRVFNNKHHIIDPTTNINPQNDIISTFVKGETALISDVCATILLIDPEMDNHLKKLFNIKTIYFKN